MKDTAKRVRMAGSWVEGNGAKEVPPGSRIVAGWNETSPLPSSSQSAPAGCVAAVREHLTEGSALRDESKQPA